MTNRKIQSFPDDVEAVGRMLVEHAGKLRRQAADGSVDTRGMSAAAFRCVEIVAGYRVEFGLAPAALRDAYKTAGQRLDARARAFAEPRKGAGE